MEGLRGCAFLYSHYQPPDPITHTHKLIIPNKGADYFIYFITTPLLTSCHPPLQAHAHAHAHTHTHTHIQTCTLQKKKSHAGSSCRCFVWSCHGLVNGCYANLDRHGQVGEGEGGSIMYIIPRIQDMRYVQNA